MAINDRRILINASFPGEIRVAQIERKSLYNLTIEQRNKTDLQDNIYLGRVAHIADQLNAAFIDIGELKNGFLPIRNLSSAMLDQASPDANGEILMSELLNVGEELIVQVRIDKRHNEGKGAALTCIISLPGQGLILMPNAPLQGISIPGTLTKDEKQRCQEYLGKISKPDDTGLIIRKTGLEMTLEELQKEVNALTDMWNKVTLAASTAKAPSLLLQEPELPWRIIRDHLNSKTDQILIDKEELYQQLKSWGKFIRPENADKIKLYTEQTPIFSHFGIARQVANTFQRHVNLPSGGSVVIDHTEALTCIDVNSGQGKKGNMEKTAFTTNSEAVTEIARQLRLRDIGGQIVIDLIQMESEDNQKRVLNSFSQSMSVDAANPKISDINEFGLLMLTRKRLRSTMADSFMAPCSHCQGSGKIATPAAMSSLILREVENEFAEENDYEQFQIFVPVGVSIYLLNQMRNTISTLEARLGTKLTIVPSPALSIPNFKIRKSNRHVDHINPIQHSDKQQLDLNAQQTQKIKSRALVDNKPSYSQTGRWHSLINKVLKLFRLGESHDNKSIIVKADLKSEKRSYRYRKNRSTAKKQSHSRSGAGNNTGERSANTENTDNNRSRSRKSGAGSRLRQQSGSGDANRGGSGRSSTRREGDGDANRGGSGRSSARREGDGDVNRGGSGRSSARREGDGRGGDRHRNRQNQRSAATSQNIADESKTEDQKSGTSTEANALNRGSANRSGGGDGAANRNSSGSSNAHREGDNRDGDRHSNRQNQRPAATSQNIADESKTEDGKSGTPTEANALNRGSANRSGGGDGAANRNSSGSSNAHREGDNRDGDRHSNQQNQRPAATSQNTADESKTEDGKSGTQTEANALNRGSDQSGRNTKQILPSADPDSNHNNSDVQAATDSKDSGTESSKAQTSENRTETVDKQRHDSDISKDSNQQPLQPNSKNDSSEGTTEPKKAQNIPDISGQKVRVPNDPRNKNNAQ